MFLRTYRRKSGFVCTRLSRCFTESQCPVSSPVKFKGFNVTVVDSLSPVGTFTHFCLKQDPLIKELRVHCKGDTVGLATDLKYIPGPRPVPTQGRSGLRAALHKADIVLLTGGQQPYDVSKDEEVFQANTKYVVNVATAVSRYCPDAIVLIDLYPINSTVPLFAEVMGQLGVYCPNKVLGVMSLHTMRARTITACVLGLDPRNVSVNVVGGGTPKTMVPVLSSSEPGGPHLVGMSMELSNAVRNMSHAVWELNKRQAVLSAAHANAAFIHQVASALTGKEVDTVAFFRTSTLYGLRYLSLPVRLGTVGVIKNYGLPKLCSSEMTVLDRAVPTLIEDIERGETAIQPLISDTVKQVMDFGYVA